MPLGTAPKNWNDKLLMFTGDTIGNQVPQACFLPSLLFTIAPAGVKVLPLQQQVLSLFADDSLEYLESAGDDVPEGQYDVIKTRHGMYLPAHLVPLFLGRRSTPRQALLSVHSALDTPEELESHRPLADWLRAAVTCNGASIIELATAPSALQLDPALAQ